MCPYAEHLYVRVSEHTIKSQSSTIACLIGHWKSKQNVCTCKLKVLTVISKHFLIFLYNLPKLSGISKTSTDR